MSIIEQNRIIINKDQIYVWLKRSIEITSYETKPIRTSELLSNYKAFNGLENTQITRGEIVTFGKELKQLIREYNLPLKNKKGIYSSYINIHLKSKNIKRDNILGLKVLLCIITTYPTFLSLAILFI